MNINLLSNRYKVKRLTENDIEEIYALCIKNTMYYRHSPPLVSKESVSDDMKALPPGKLMDDKFYLGYFDGDRLIAVLDLIMHFPDEHTAFIGFFMTDVGVQKTGTGSEIISELCGGLSALGISHLRLAWIKGNSQAEHFWHKNGFTELKESCDDDRLVVVATRDI